MNELPPKFIAERIVLCVTCLCAVVYLVLKLFGRIAHKDRKCAQFANHSNPALNRRTLVSYQKTGGFPRKSPNESSYTATQRGILDEETILNA
jgi:hypothetical protein